MAGSTDGTVSVMLGLRADFNVSVTVGRADSEPGAGADDGVVFGGGGCGGVESLGSVYYIQQARPLLVIRRGKATTNKFPGSVPPLGKR